MVKAYLHKEHRDALDQIKVLFLKSESPLNTKELGDQLRIFAAGNTKEINDDERKLLFDIVDQYLHDETIVYFCMGALKCNIKEGLVFMGNSVMASRICITTNSVSKVYHNNVLFVNLMASIFASLTQHREAVILLMQNGFQDNFLEIMKTAIASQGRFTGTNLGLMWCSRIFNNIFVSGLFDDDFFASFGMNALSLLIKGMSSTSDYFTFEDSVDTIINICEKMSANSNSRKLLRQYLVDTVNFDDFLRIQLEKYPDHNVFFKKSFVGKLVELELVHRENFTEKCL